METKRQIITENAVTLGRLGLEAPQVASLQRLARSLHRLYEMECNTELTPRQNQRMERLEREVTDIAQAAGLYVYHQTDPRGWPVIIAKEPIKENATSRHDRVCPL